MVEISKSCTSKHLSAALHVVYQVVNLPSCTSRDTLYLISRSPTPKYNNHGKSSNHGREDVGIFPHRAEERRYQP